MPAKSRFATIDEDLANRLGPSTCKTCDFIANPGRYEASRADAEFIADLLPVRSAEHVAKVLAAGGVKIGETSIKRHRAKHMSQ